MADVVMKCSGGDFDGLSFSVPEKEQMAYAVILGSTVVVYSEITREGSEVVCEAR